MGGNRFRGRALGLLMCAPLLLEAQIPRLTVDTTRRHQTIDGFGVNFNGTYFREGQKPLIDLLIDDLGATLFRLDPYGLSNWEAINDNADPAAMNQDYYNDRYSIPAFEASWAAARYLNSRGIQPFLTLSGIAPDWMIATRYPEPGKKTGEPGQYALKREMYEEFAETVASMLLYARTRARIDFEYFSPVNETDCAPREGPYVSPQDFPDLLGAIEKRLAKEGLSDVRLVIADQCGLKNDYFGPVLARPELMKQVSVFSLHSYGRETLGPHVERIRNSKYPHVPVWLTEYGDLNDLDRSAENEWTNFCVLASRRVLRALNEGASAALFWDAYDNYHEHDQRMTYYGLVKNTDHIFAPKKRYFAAKQLYRFVRPGARRVELKADVPGMQAAAFRHRDGSVVIVGLKEGGPERVQLAVEGADISAWEVYQTTRRLNCAHTGTVRASGDAAEIELPEDAVFTAVGRPKP